MYFINKYLSYIKQSRYVYLKYKLFKENSSFFSGYLKIFEKIVFWEFEIDRYMDMVVHIYF